MAEHETTVFVSSLPWHVTDAHLELVLGQFSEVAEARVTQDRSMRRAWSVALGLLLLAWACLSATSLRGCYLRARAAALAEQEARAHAIPVRRVKIIGSRWQMRELAMTAPYRRRQAMARTARQGSPMPVPVAIARPVPGCFCIPAPAARDPWRRQPAPPANDGRAVCRAYRLTPARAVSRGAQRDGVRAAAPPGGLSCPCRPSTPHGGLR
jgi:hypothetical protein